MPCPGKKHRKHTEITTEKQRGFFGAEYARKKKGRKGRTKVSKAVLASHLEEAGGKKLPRKRRGKK